MAQYYNKFIPPKGVFVNNEDKTTFLNMACTFDIETTSFKVGENKCATMYLWQFAITSKCACYGRKWGEFIEFLNMLENYYRLNKKRKMIIYIHNAGFECSFLLSVLGLEKAFATKAHSPMYFTYRYFIFKDSYILSGLSLRRTLEECNCPIDIMKTELDYSLKRHSETPLNDDEIKYGLNDVLGLAYYIETEIEKNGDITQIPLTKTGYARRFVRDKCFEYDTYKELIDRIQIRNVDLYNTLKRAFTGGYTHANPYFVNRVVNNVASIDFTSSYPSVMIRKKYPMSKFIQLNIDKNNLDDMCNKYCCVFDIAFTNLESKSFVHTISRHKVYTQGEIIEDNGRIVKADYLQCTITEVDFEDIKKFYTYDDYEIGNFYYAKRGYLPKPIIECILELYDNKTKLKGVEGKEDLYLVSKGILNAMYGMCVCDIVQKNFTIDSGEWVENSNSPEMCIFKNAKNKRTFLFYGWGVYVTAYARHELYKGIFETQKNNDFIYSDTDSIKFRNYNHYNEWIEKYNSECVEELKACCDYYNLDSSKLDPDGKHQLGIWDFEGVYDKFKTLGCKRYLYVQGSFKRRERYTEKWCNINNYNRCVRVESIFEKSQKWSLTVAGLNKKEPLKYILDRGAFKFFNNRMKIPPEYSGRLTHTYLNNQTPVFLYDYMGNKYLCEDKSGVYLEKTEYNLSFKDIFLQYLEGIKTADTQRVDTILKGVMNDE